MSSHFQMPLWESCGNNHSRDYVPCGTCGTQFRTKGQLKKHKQICGKNVKNSLKNLKPEQIQKLQAPNDKMPVKIHKCKIHKCGCRFLRKDALHRHLQTQHKDIHTCPCGRAFMENHNLHSHQSTFSKCAPYKCTLCGMDFELKCVYRIHKKAHKNDKTVPHPCEKCGKSFPVKSSLNQHMLNQNCSSFECSCGSKFSTKRQVERHKQLCRKVNKIMCQESSKSSDKLSGTTMYPCLLCKDVFPTRIARRRHRQICYQNIHKCQCGQAFRKKKSLLTHQCSLSNDAA